MNKILTVLTLLIFPITLSAEPKVKNDPAASELFQKVYELVFGPAGSSLTYNVNIIGIYKTQGEIIYKGEKKQYKGTKHMAWEDGETAYMVDTKKKTIDIYRCDDDSRDKYLSKFKFTPNNFEYSYSTEGDFYLIKAKLKKTSLFGIRDITIKAQKKNLYPVSATIKLALMKTTVKISNFKAGNIDDATFIFPKNKFPGYEYKDHR